MKKKMILIAAFLLSAHLAGCDPDGAVSLEWKLQPGTETLYRSVTGPLAHAIIPADHAFFQKGQPLPPDERLKFIGAKFNSGSEYQLHLVPSESGGFSVEMKLVKVNFQGISKKIWDEPFRKQLKKLIGKTVMKAELNKHGEITTAGMPQQHKNLFVVMFELPKRKVSLGDSWEISVRYLELGPNYTETEGSVMNEIRVVDLYKEGEDQIAAIEYKIREYTKGELKTPGGNALVEGELSFAGVGLFSVKNGRWLRFSGQMYNKSSFPSAKESYNSFLIEEHKK